MTRYAVIVETAHLRPHLARLFKRIGRQENVRVVDVREVTRSNKQRNCSNGSGLGSSGRAASDCVLPAAGMNTWHGVDCGVASSATGRQT